MAARGGHARRLVLHDHARSRNARSYALIGIDYSGRIVRDGHPSYRVFEKAQSQTCLAHLLRRIDGLLEVYKEPRAESWLRSMKRVLKRSVRISQRRDAAEIGPHGLMVAIGKVEKDVDHLLEEVPRGEEVQRLARHLGRERSALFTFLTTTRLRRPTFSPNRLFVRQW